MFSLFSCYLKLERCQSTKKDGTKNTTPRYVVSAQAGYFKPLEAIKNGKGEIVMYCQRNDKCNPNSTAETRLQCKGSKGSVNFSSIYFENLKIGETLLIGCGEPPEEKTLKPLKKKKKDGSITFVERPNPFFESKTDAYLFIIVPDQDGYPATIEILIVPNGRALIRGYAAKLADGQLDDALEQMRNEAKAITK